MSASVATLPMSKATPRVTAELSKSSRTTGVMSSALAASAGQSASGSPGNKFRRSLYDTKQRDPTRRYIIDDQEEEPGPYNPSKGPAPDMSRRTLIFDSLQKVVSSSFQKESSLAPTSKQAAADRFPHRGTFVWTWGAGYQGQLGPDPKQLRGKSKCQVVPFQFSPPSPIRYVACGGNATAALNDDGHLWLWGQTVLEFEPTDQRNETEPVFTNCNLVKVALSRGGIAAISQTGQLYYAGFVRSKPKELEPVMLSSPEYFVDVSCGDNHVAAVTKSGVLYTFGSSEHGQLGHGKPENKSKAEETYPRKVDFSKSVPAGESVFVIGVSCGSIHTACVTNKGEVFVFGFGENLIPGHDSFFYHPVKVNFPAPITPPSGLPGEGPGGADITSPTANTEFIVQVACGHGHVVARTARGDVYCWGDGKEGQLGSADSTKTPRLALAGKGIVQVAAGRYHTMALTSFGAVYAWGNGENGQLGLGKDVSKSTVPRVIESNLGAVIGLIACGEHHSCALSSTPWRASESSVREWVAVERKESELKVDRTWIRHRDLPSEVNGFIQERKANQAKEERMNEEIIEGEQRAIVPATDLRNRVFKNVLQQESAGLWGGNTLTDSTKYITLHDYYQSNLTDGMIENGGSTQDGFITSSSTGGYLDRAKTAGAGRTIALPQLPGARPATTSSGANRQQLAATQPSGALVESGGVLLPTRGAPASSVAVHSHFLRETNSLVADMKATVAQTLDTPTDMRMAHTWVTSRRQMCDALTTEAQNLELKLLQLHRQIDSEARSQLALAEMHEQFQQQRSQLEMRLSTAQIQIKETTQNKKNYDLNIAHLKSEDFDSRIAEKNTNQDIGAQEARIRKFNETKLRALADRDRTQRELQAFSAEVKEYTKFMQDQIVAFRELHQKALDREARRERAKQAKREQQMRVYAEKIAELNTEMIKRMEEAQKKTNSLKGLNERLGFYKQRLQQITAITGLTDQDEIIRKFQLKEKLLQELEHEIESKKNYKRELEIKEQELQQRLVDHSKNAVECTWKDVERKEEELRECNSQLVRLEDQTEQASERLARLQEGLIALLSKLPDPIAPRVDRDKEPLNVLAHKPQESKPDIPRLTNAAQGASGADDANKEYFLTLEDDRSLETGVHIEERTLDLALLLSTKLSELNNQVHDRESEKRRRVAEEHEKRSLENMRDFGDLAMSSRRR